MIYAYKCRTCGLTHDSKYRGDTLGACIGPDCTGELRRLFIIRTEAQMQEHWNKTLNRPISSNQQFDEALKRESDIVSLRTGMAHKFERVDPTDKAKLGVTDEGMDATNRQRHKQGLPTV
jgi:hypothetical protein